MIAMIRSASKTPSSISLANSLASATEWIGTLRTSIADGTSGVLPCQRLGVGRPDHTGSSFGVDRIGDLRQGRDDPGPPPGVGKAHDGLDLGPHGALGEALLRGDAVHLLHSDTSDGTGAI